MYLSERLEVIFTENWDGDYNSSIGRFISEDPSGYGGSDVSLYRFCFNNPIIYLDSDGNQARLGEIVVKPISWVGGGGLLGIGLITNPITEPNFSDPVLNKKNKDLRPLSEEELKELGIDGHEYKKDWLGKKTEIKKYDIYIDTKTGEIVISDKKRKVRIETGDDGRIKRTCTE